MTTAFVESIERRVYLNISYQYIVQLRSDLIDISTEKYILLIDLFAVITLII
jgi:hypothetical protein